MSLQTFLIRIRVARRTWQENCTLKVLNAARRWYSVQRCVDTSILPCSACLQVGFQDLIAADFCHSRLLISPGGVLVQIPGGFSFDMMQHWDGKPVRFVCCERLPKGRRKDSMAWGRVFWCVAIEAVDEQ